MCVLWNDVLGACSVSAYSKHSPIPTAATTPHASPPIALALSAALFAVALAAALLALANTPPVLLLALAAAALLALAELAV